MNISRIILADDSGILLTGLVQLLKTEFPEAEIKAVETGQALLKEITLKKWDIVISDIDMPGRSGLEILEQLKLLRPDLPVLILSMYKEDIYAARVMKAGAAGYLMKTSATTELVHAVRHIATGKKYITPEIAEQLLDSFKEIKKPHELLTNKEFEIFKMLALGKTVTQIATEISMASATVSFHRKKILDKMNLTSNANLTHYAITNHIISDI